MVSSTKAARRRRARRALIGGVVVVALIVGIAIVRSRSGAKSVAGPACVATAGQVSYPLDMDQAANATTIAAVGKRLGLADHAVTIALAAALQESGLHNLSGGDRDSLGLFQQRPSQGWGSPEQIMVPRLAAAAFYGGLAKVTGWQTRAVTDAAQAVQHSAAPSAYARWEAEARVIAQALTGEVAAGLTCRFAAPSGAPALASLSRTMEAELGSPALGTTVDSGRGWLVASWLIGHGEQFGVSSVSFAGQRWTPTSGAWRAHPPVTSTVEI